MKKKNKIVLTGAAGRLGSYLREPLTRLAEQVTSTDIAEDIGTLYPGETYVRADLDDPLVATMTGSSTYTCKPTSPIPAARRSCWRRTPSPAGGCAPEPSPTASMWMTRRSSSVRTTARPCG